MRSPRTTRGWRICFSLAFLAACGGGGEDAGDDVIRIGAIFDLTGPTADIGTDYADAVRGWVEWTNGRGGIAGRQIDLVFQDYAYSVDRAEQLYSQFVQEGAIVFMGWGTGDTEALVPRVADDRIPFSSASLSHRLGDPAEAPYNFLTATSYSQQFLVALDWIAADHAEKGGSGGAGVALLHHASPFGLSPWTQLGEEYASRIGVDVELYEMPRGATDFTAEMTRIRQSGAGYIVIQNTSAPASVAVRNARSLGLDATIVCLNWCSNALLVELAGEAAEGVIGGMPYPPPDADVAGLADLGAFLEARGEDVSARTNAYTQGWFTAEIFGEGLRRAAATGEPLTGESVRAALETLTDFETGGVTVPITFSADDHRGSNGMRIYRVEGGQWRPVTDFMTAPAVP
ncbi:MAG: ABC transporter substrate-binding protein [Gemmatimonadota bacterium]|nr:ABC transporter substrate-binding protein [Gemmatimonadota bacterium]